VSQYICHRRPDHPLARKDGRVPDHRAIMCQMVGRSLNPGEVVHHINGDPKDNRPENLRLYASNAEHIREHLAADGHCSACGADGKKTTRGMCFPCYRKFRQAAADTPCTVCGKVTWLRDGLCEACYMRRRYHRLGPYRVCAPHGSKWAGKTCTCGAPASCVGMCRTCYERERWIGRRTQGRISHEQSQ
jgi:hypothetical protein